MLIENKYDHAEIPWEYDPDVFWHIHSYTDDEIIERSYIMSRGNQLDPDISWNQYLLNELTHRFEKLKKASE